MIPGMAIITSAANPQLRGTFMALNSAVQSAAMGLAAFVGGLDHQSRCSKSSSALLDSWDVGCHIAA